MPTASSSHARLAGLLYLVPMFLGPFSMMYVPSVIAVPGDPVATVEHLLASASLYRMGMLSDALIVLAELALTAVLYGLLRPAGPTLALTATLARAAMTVLQAANLLPALAALSLASETSPEPTMLALRLHDLSALLWQIPFGFHCLLVGVLVFRSGLFPRVLGVLLAIAGAGYALNGLGCLVLPESAATLAAIVGLTAVVGEVPFVLYLVFKGVESAERTGHHRRA